MEELIKTSSLKLILCSSINDKDIRDEVIKTINTFGGNITILNMHTQHYYFYFPQNFFEIKLSGNVEYDELFQLFYYKPKFKYLLLKWKGFRPMYNFIKYKK